MDKVALLAASTDRLLLCCMCQHLLCEAVQLKCLHNCCRQCFRAAESAAVSEGVSCATCGLVTPRGSEQPNGFLDGRVHHYRSIAESRVCGICKGNGEHDKPALVWCAPCRHSLCGDCIAAHRQYNRQHVTQSLEELRSLDEVCVQPTASVCAIHGKLLEVACRNCEQAKCIRCLAECHEKKHEIYFVGKEAFDSYVSKVTASIASIESELLRKSEVLQKPKSMLLDMKAARDRHLQDIGARKRRVVDAVEMVYQEIEFSTKNAYDELESECHATAAVGDRIDADLSDARDYIRRLLESNEKCEILNQQKILRERLGALSAELDRLSNRSMKTTKSEVKIESSLPDDVEDVVRAWIGTHRVDAEPSAADPSPLQLSRHQEQQQVSSSRPTSQQQQQQSFTFGTASASFKLPVTCYDVALTQDGRSLLLAARQHGLIELSSATRRELSCWLPPKTSSSSLDEWVQAVTALHDGRAAVSLYCAQLVVLLRRNVTRSSTAAAAGDDAWTEVRRIQLQFGPRCLSAHGDLLAAAAEYGRQLQLLSLSSRQPLSDAVLQREYVIGSLAVAARVLVTGSSSKVELAGGRQAAHVLDAHSLDADADGSSDKRLWRHVLCSSSNSSSEQQEELLLGVCADSSGGCLYAAVCRSDRSSGRVSVLSLTDGSELRGVALSFCSAAAATQPLLLPRRLSLCDDRAAAEQQQQQGQSSSRQQLLLAVLCWDSATRDQKTVTLHRSSTDMLQ